MVPISGSGLAVVVVVVVVEGVKSIDVYMNPWPNWPLVLLHRRGIVGFGGGGFRSISGSGSGVGVGFALGISEYVLWGFCVCVDEGNTIKCVEGEK